MELSHDDRQMIGALVRDRLGMEARALEIDRAVLQWLVEIDELRARIEGAKFERETLKASIHELSNTTLAAKFECSTNTIWHLVRGR